ncbi:cell division protein FtsA [bacterium]|nr:cell division protein FtsA [bacterium]MBU1880544.1 cell division protein FtsA [bacterium]
MGGRKRVSGEKDQDVLVGLDLGTSNTTVIIAERVDSKLNVIGMGASPSVGMKHGVVVNIEQTVDSIISAIEEAERMADVSVESVYAVISGDHIRSINSKGMIAVGRSNNGTGNKIGHEDIQRVIETAQTIQFPADREVLHVIPQDFLVDNREGFKDPVGIVGLRLEANVHIVTAAVAAVQTIMYCLQEVKIQPIELVLQSLAASLAVLTEDERELGVVVVDIGGGTTDIAVYHEGAIRHTSVVPLGGESVTRDLAHGLRIPRSEAEALKLEHGCAHPSQISSNEPLVLSGSDDRPDRHVTKDIIYSIIQPRMEEIYELVIRDLRQAEFMQKLTAGVVLTGGASLIPGAVDLAEEIFALPARLGKPKGLGRLSEVADSPAHATAAGIVLHGARQQDAEIRGLRAPRKRRKAMRMGNTKFDNFRKILADFF